MEKKIIRKVGYLKGSYQDAWSIKHKISAYPKENKMCPLLLLLLLLLLL